MVQKYTTSDIDLFSKILKSENNTYYKKKLKDKNLDKPLISYPNKDEHKLDNLENIVKDNDSKKNESLFFSLLDL